MFAHHNQMDFYLNLNYRLESFFDELEERKRQEKQMLNKQKRAKARSKSTGSERKLSKGCRAPKVELTPSSTDDYVIQLNSFLHQVPYATWSAGKYLAIDRAFAHMEFARANFHEVIHIISKIGPTRNGLIAEIDSLWYQAWYRVHQGKRRHELGNLSPVDKFRIRKKHPSPNDERDSKRYGFSKEVKQQLYHEFQRDPKPSKEQKRLLAHYHGLEESQISNFFKNRRQREKLEARTGRKRNESFCSTTSSYSNSSSASTSSELVHAVNPFYDEPSYYVTPEALLAQPHEISTQQQATDEGEEDAEAEDDSQIYTQYSSDYTQIANQNELYYDYQTGTCLPLEAVVPLYHFDHYANLWPTHPESIL